MDNNFKISVDVNIALSESTKSFLAQFLSAKPAVATAATTPESAVATVATTPESAVATASKPAVATATTTPKPAVATVATTPEPAKPAVAKPTGTISIEDVRKELAAKVNNHRDEIKAKLNELGASSVSTLNCDKYSIMLNFLRSLE